MGAAAVAAVIIRREKELVAHFEQMRATSPASAQSVEALRVEHNQFFRRLEQRAVIRQSPTGLYYLDQPSWIAMNATRRRQMFIVMGIVIAISAAVVYTAQSRVRQDTPAALNTQ